jgi:hypothetical protein
LLKKAGTSIIEFSASMASKYRRGSLYLLFYTGRSQGWTDNHYGTR